LNPNRASLIPTRLVRKTARQETAPAGAVLLERAITIKEAGMKIDWAYMRKG